MDAGVILCGGRGGVKIKELCCWWMRWVVYVSRRVSVSACLFACTLLWGMLTTVCFPSSDAGLERKTKIVFLSVWGRIGTEETWHVAYSLCQDRTFVSSHCSPTCRAGRLWITCLRGIDHLYARNAEHRWHCFLKTGLWCTTGIYWRLLKAVLGRSNFCR